MVPGRRERKGMNNWQLRRHTEPGHYGPFGNMAFLDGHVKTGVDYLSTCSDASGNYDEGVAVRWWSFTGQ